MAIEEGHVQELLVVEHCNKLKRLRNIIWKKKGSTLIAEIWKNDTELGRQILNGANPTQLRRVTKYTDDIRRIGQHYRPSSKLGHDWEIEVYVSRLYTYLWFHNKNRFICVQAVHSEFAMCSCGGGSNAFHNNFRMVTYTRWTINCWSR